MHLSIYSLKETLFDGEAKSLNCMTEAGEITILDHHRPLIAPLKPCTMKIIYPVRSSPSEDPVGARGAGATSNGIDKSNQEEYINVSSGFLEVGVNAVHCIVEEKSSAVPVQ